VTTPTWQDLSPEQAHELARGPAYDDPNDPVKQGPSLFGLCCVGGLFGAVLFRCLNVKPRREEPGPVAEYEALQPEYVAALKAHRSAMKRVQLRAEESARLAQEELDELGRIEVD
jgi:hypothetical protein